MIIIPQDHLAKMEMATPLKNLVSQLSSCPESELPSLLHENMEWNKPRGDLYHWIEVLNRFDQIFHQLIDKYDLENQVKLSLFESDDETLVVACLNFVFVLLEHCENRNVFNSSERIFALINTCSIKVRLSALEVSVSLVERHSSKVPTTKELKKKVLQIIHSYPPLVPLTFTSDDQTVVGDHFSYVESLKHRPVPEKWQLINFSFYKLSPQKPPLKRKIDENLCSFSINAENVRKLSIEQIFDKATELVPQDKWFEFSLEAHVAKSFNTSTHDALELRQDLLRCKLYGLCFIICSSNEEYISSRVFEQEPYIFNFLVDMIVPSNMDDLSPEVYFLAVKALGCISLKKVWGGELVRSLGGNVNHGILYQSLRHIHKHLLTSQHGDKLKGYIYFFNMLGNLIDAKSLTSRLSSGGLLRELMSFMVDPHKYWWHASAAVHLISIFLFNSPESITDFVNNNGFDTIIKVVGHEVDQAVADPHADGGAPKDAVVHYSISFRKANFMRNLLKLVNYLIRWDSGDRLRNLFDSPILQSFNKILENPQIFGPMILLSTIDSIVNIIHNEPTAFAILNEANVIDTVISRFGTFFMPDGDLLVSLPEVLGAIALNKEGLEKVEKNDCFTTYFQIFRLVEYCKVLCKNYKASTLGESFDELGRHYNSFKPIIIENVKKMVNEIPGFVNERIQGIRFFTDDDNLIETWDDSEYGSIFQASAAFLRGLVSDGNWSNEILNEVKFGEWLNLLKVPNFPYDFAIECFSIVELFAYFVDQEDDKHNLPEFCQFLKSTVESPLLQEFLQFPDDKSFFDVISENSDNCTKFLQDMNLVFIAMSGNALKWSIVSHENYKLVTECLGDDEGIKFISTLGSLLRKVIIEENFMRANLDKEILIETTCQPEEGSEDPKIRIFVEKPDSERKKNHEIKTLALYKNVLQMRSLCFQLTHLISDTFKFLGKLVMHRRQEYAQANMRRNAVKINSEIGKVFGAMMSAWSLDLPNHDSYLFVTLSIIWYVLHVRDRGKDMIQTSVAYGLLQSSVVDAIARLATELFISVPAVSNKAYDDEYLKYAIQDTQCLHIHSLYWTMNILSSLTDGDHYTSLSNLGYFFHDGLDEADASGTAAAFARSLCYGLVQKGINSISKSVANLPTVVMEKFLAVVEDVYEHYNKEDVTKFVALDYRNVSPPLEPTNYLVSLGLSEANAIHYFKHTRTLGPLSLGEWPCSTSNLEADEISRLSVALKNDERQFPNDYAIIPLGETVEISVEESVWFDLARLYPTLSLSLAEFLNKERKMPVDYVLGRLGKIVHEGISGDDEEFLKSGMVLVQAILNATFAAFTSSSDEFRLKLYKDIAKIFTKLLKENGDIVNEDYCAIGLEIIGQGLVFSDVIEPEEISASKLVNNTAVRRVMILDEEEQTGLFDVLSQLESLSNKKSISAVINIFTILCKKQDKREQLAESSVVHQLVASGTLFTAENTPENLKSQQLLAVLLRRCFETPEVIKVNMVADFKDLTIQKSRKQLFFFLRECSTLVFRDPEIFTEVISKKIRISEYNGDTMYTTSVPISFIHDDDKEDVEMSDVETKSRPAEMMRPSAVIHAIIAELIKVCKKDIYSTPENSEPKDKKKDRKISEIFQNKDFSYACYLLQLLTELLGSYMRCKLEFVSYSKKESGDLKPRSTALNVLIHQLIPTKLLDSSTGIEFERRASISSLSKLAILALVSTPVLDEANSPRPKKEDADMAFIRKFCTDLIIKAMKDTAAAPQPMAVSYGKLVDIFELISALLSNKFRQVTGPLLNKDATKYDPFFIAKSLIDNQVPGHVTSLIASLDLNSPHIEKVIKASIHPLTLLGKAKAEFQESFEEERQTGDREDDLPELEDDDRDEPQDLFKNSTLGMYDIEYETEDEEMDYYGEEPGLDALSGEDISEGPEGETDDDSDMDGSDLDSDDMDEDGDDIEQVEAELMDDTSMMDSFHFQQGEDEDSGSEEESEYDESDVEIIDTTVGMNGEDGNEYYIESYGEEEDFEDRSSSEYDEAELDGWIEDLDDSESEAEENENGEPNGIEATRGFNFGGERADTHDVFDGDDFDSDGDSTADEAVGGIGIGNGGRRNNEFATSFFDALRPSGNRSLADVFGGIIRLAVPVPHGTLIRFDTGRGGLDVDGNRYERAIENILDFASKPLSSSQDPLHNLYIKSTVERWSDSVSEFQKRNKDKILPLVLPGIINRVGEKSLEFEKKRQEKIQQANKEREERRIKKEEEEKAKKEAEAKERENEMANEPRPSLEPVMVSIGDRQVDISGTDIDPEFFEALPDDMREEVFTQHIRERRANARRTSTADSTREIDPDFLDALPDQIRDEILQQESMARYSFMRDDEDEEEDGDDFDSEHEFLDELEGGTGGQVETAEEEKSDKKKKKKTFFTPLVDKAGIASLVRLLFVPQTINKRDNIHQALKYLCYNKQTRIELVNLLMSILHDGLVNHKPNDKIFYQLSLKCQRDNKTKSIVPLNSSPVVVADQVLDLLLFLLENNHQLRYFFLTEHDNPYLHRKSKKKRELVSKTDRYQINHLLKLVDTNVLREDQPFLDILSRILQLTTRPLKLLNSKEQKSIPFSPPYVPNHLLSRMIKFLTSNDCPNTTFTRAISAMQSLTYLKDSQQVFSRELSDQASNLGKNIIKDLNALTEELKDGNYDSESKSFGKFNASSSDQAKLLRVLTALDYMFDKKNDEAKVVDDVEELAGLYNKLALGSLWDALSDCLKVLEEHAQLVNIATILLPLIEALMVVCKHSKVRDHVKDAVKFEVKKVDFTKEPIESLFFSFTEEHKKILNQMVRSNPNLMSGPFAMLVSNPKVLEFDNKKNYFDRRLHENLNEEKTLTINVRRDQVFLDSYRAIFFKSKDEFRNSKLDVNFKGESGIDAGGVTREWYQVLSRQMFNPDYALFTPVATDSNTYHPNRTSYINPEHLSFFKFIGKVIGKAIFDNCYLDCHFSRAVYKRLLGRNVSLKDMETLDVEYFKSLMWILENDITDVITEDFLVETDDYGEKKIIDLIPDGRNIPVTEDNKQEYVRKVVEYRLQTSVTEQMDNFLMGFHEIIPKEIVSIFDEQELELLISGLPDIDVQDWQNNTIYNNYSPSSIQIQWFWRAVKSFDNEERAKLLQFATGTSKVPLNGFKELSGANNESKFSIHRDYGPLDRLPSSHTCFNQIDLPAYESYETLRGSLLLAITEGHEGFGLA